MSSASRKAVSWSAANDASGMTYFSLLDPQSPDIDGDYRVEQCHINIWSLPGLLGHRPMVFDVGVVLESATPLVQAIEMVVPVRVVRLIDLSQEVADNSNGRLIFGRHFQGAQGSLITLSGLGAVPVVGVSEQLDVTVDRELTVVRVVLGAGMPSSGPAYVRMRLVADNAYPMWRWRWVLGRRNGALIDFRVHDPREGGYEQRAHPDLRDRDKEIPKLDAFFMLPERFQISGQNPALEYTRTLEGDRWKRYLHRSPYGLLRNEPILVHRWKRHERQSLSGTTRPGVDADNPFRGYLQFNRVPSFRSVSDTLLVAIATAFTALALLRPNTLRNGPETVFQSLADVLTDAGAKIVDQIIAAGLLGAILVIYGLLSRADKAPRFLALVKRSLKRWEFQWYRRLDP